MSTIGVSVTKDDDVEFVAEAAGLLVKELAESVSADLANGDVGFVAGIFCVVAANNFSYRVGAQFEPSASVALLRLQGHSEGFAEKHATIIGGYNEMSRSGRKVIQAIGNTIATWSDAPSTDNWKKLQALFKLILQHEGGDHAADEYSPE